MPDKAKKKKPDTVKVTLELDERTAASFWANNYGPEYDRDLSDVLQKHVHSNARGFEKTFPDEEVQEALMLFRRKYRARKPEPSYKDAEWLDAAGVAAVFCIGSTRLEQLRREGLVKWAPLPIRKGQGGTHNRFLVNAASVREYLESQVRTTRAPCLPTA